MFCGNCGTNIEDNAVFCPNCGAQVNASNNQVQNSQQNNLENNNPVMPEQNQVNTQEQMPFANQLDMQNQIPLTNQLDMQNQMPEQNQVNTQEQMPFANEPNMPEQMPFANQPENQDPQQMPMYGQGDMNNWNNNMAPNFNVEEKPKKKFPKKLLFIGIPVILVVVAIICNLSAISGFFVKSFGSDSDYLRYVEVNDLTTYCDSVSTIYDAYLLENADMKVAQNANVSFEVTDDGIAMLEELAGDSMDFAWLQDIDLSIESNMHDNQSVKGNLKISGKDIVSLDMINDLENAMVYIAIPELSDQYLGMELTEEDLTAMMEATDGLEEVLPSEKELNKLLTKYLKIAFDSISDAEMSKDTLTAGDLSKKCTTVEIEIDERLMYEMINNILEEAKNDKELQKIVTDFVALMAETDPTYEDVDVEGFFADDIDLAQENIAEMLDNLDGDGEVYATLVDYIDSNHEIIGRSIIVEDEEVVKYAMITKGGKFGFELNATDQFVITGSGKKNNKTITGDFEVLVADQELITFSLDKFNTKKLEAGELEGKITVAMGADMETLVAGEGGATTASILAMMLDYSIEMSFDNDSKGGTTSIALLDAGEKLVAITSTVEVKSPSKVSAPDSSKVIEVTEDDSEAMMDYVETIDITTIVNNLEDAGVPDEIIDYVESAVDSIGYTSSYDYDDFDLDAYADIDI